MWCVVRSVCFCRAAEQSKQWVSNLPCTVTGPARPLAADTDPRYLERETR